MSGGILGPATEPVRHLFLAGGIPALVLLSAVAAYLSIADAFVDLPRAAVGTLAGASGAALAGLEVFADLGGGVVVGAALAATAGTVLAAPDRAGPGSTLALAVLATLVVGLSVDVRVDGFGTYRPLPVPVQSLFVVWPGAACLPMGYAAVAGHRARWPLALSVVASPAVVLAQAVPVAGIGPFFLAVFLAPWALLSAAVGAVLFVAGASVADLPDRSPAETPGSWPVVGR